jgi:aspartyl-tRNA(Asn)/glutamyl-tRNA(Gln) amidotransferase subunit A
MDLHRLSIHEAANWIAAGQLSPLTLVEAHLARIESLDRKLNAFITLTSLQALEQARQAEAEIRRGRLRSPLHGIPLALKDLYETAEIRTTAGSRFFRDNVPTSDAAAVAALSQAGAVLLGKLNMHEIALGLTSENIHFGFCRNPWDTGRISGGSSGGSGAALAAGLCMGSLGSDTGGSIRVPAALCGVVGLKPTYGRVSLRGVMPLSWCLDHPGPMARCVRDVALLLQAVAGFDLGDPASQDVAVGDNLANLEAGVQGWRIALASGDYFREVEAGVWSCVELAAGVFKELGAQVEQVDIPNFETAASANTSIIQAEAAVIHQERLAARPGDFGEDVRLRLQKGAEQPLAEYIHARRTQAVFRRQMEIFFSRYDLLLMATAPVVAPPIQQDEALRRARSLTRFTSAFNLIGFPAISLPCGFVEMGGKPLPVGLQIISRPWTESALLRAAYTYEQAAGWHAFSPRLD